MFDKKTTDLNVIRRTPSRFTWGRVETIHDIGRYTLVEYIDTKEVSSTHNATLYHSYVDGKSTHSSHLSLEAGLIYAIAVGAIENVNDARHMARAACKVLDVKGE